MKITVDDNNIIYLESDTIVDIDTKNSIGNNSINDNIPSPFKHETYSNDNPTSSENIDSATTNDLVNISAENIIINDMNTENSNIDYASNINATSAINSNTLSSKINNNTHINFNRNPSTFTAVLSDCLLDNHCKVIYHHIQKTGGKTVEYRMFHAFPNQIYKRKQIRCCFEKTENEFSRAKKILCKEKFTSYEVDSKQFENMVRKCQKINHVKGEDPDRNVVLVSIRKPQDRMLSRINAFCNVRFYKRPKEIQEACLSCFYQDYKKVFNSFALGTNEVFEMAYNTTQLQIPNVPVLSFDTYDIDDMFDRLEIKTNISFVKETKNLARHQRCTNFTMNDELYDLLEPSVYSTMHLI